jgi:hypothetical protein
VRIRRLAVSKGEERMTGFHDDILKLMAKRIRLQSNHKEKKPIIHIKINFDKCYQLFEHEDWSTPYVRRRRLFVYKAPSRCAG